MSPRDHPSTPGDKAYEKEGGSASFNKLRFDRPGVHIRRRVDDVASTFVRQIVFLLERPGFPSAIHFEMQLRPAWLFSDLRDDLSLCHRISDRYHRRAHFSVTNYNVIIVVDVSVLYRYDARSILVKAACRL